LYSLEATDSSGTIDENKADLDKVEEIQTSKIVETQENNGDQF